jgi:hypothetical protein
MTGTVAAANKILCLGDHQYFLIVDRVGLDVEGDPSHVRLQHAATWTARALGDVEELVGSSQCQCVPRVGCPVVIRIMIGPT